MSNECVFIMNNFVDDILCRVMEEADNLRVRRKRITCQVEDIRTAVKLLLPKRIHLHAADEAEKALFLSKLDGVFTRLIEF